MAKFRPLFLALGLSLLVLAASSCIGVSIIRDCPDPDSYFARASREVERLDARRSFGRGPVHTLCVLAYDHDDGELVRVEVPMWLAKAFLNAGLSAAEHGRDFGVEERYGIDWRKFRDLDQFGPGLLVSVDDEESRVLVWLR